MVFISFSYCVKTSFYSLPIRIFYKATLVLEFFDGLSLQAAVQEKHMPEHIAHSLCQALFDAVAHVHSLNILHRDIKPPNILVSRCLRDLRLIDFNVATSMDSECSGPVGLSSWVANLKTM